MINVDGKLVTADGSVGRWLGLSVQRESIVTLKRSSKTKTVTMKVLGARSNLDSFLRSIKNTRIDIAAAFASKTETLIEHILNNGNKLDLIIGTINCFSDPVFINFCRNVAKRNSSRFDFWVDFRGDDSLHWKVYLVAPDTVVIGSPNLTTTGLSMQRDTAVVFKDKRLYQVYRTLFAGIKKNGNVVNWGDSKFEGILAQYEKQHRRMLAKPRIAIADTRSTASLQDFGKWLDQDAPHVLPIFVWQRDVTPAEESLFKKKIRPKIASSLTSGKKKTLGDEPYIIGVYEGKRSKRDYDSGNVILTMKSTGAHIQFQLAEVVIHGAGNWWLCGFKRKHVPKPFVLTPKLKAAIKQNSAKWFDADKAYLNSSDLRGLAKFLASQ